MMLEQVLQSEFARGENSTHTNRTKSTAIVEAVNRIISRQQGSQQQQHQELLLRLPPDFGLALGEAFAFPFPFGLALAFAAPAAGAPPLLATLLRRSSWRWVSRWVGHVHDSKYI